MNFDEYNWRQVKDSAGRYVHWWTDHIYPGQNSWDADRCSAGAHPDCMKPPPVNIPLPEPIKGSCKVCGCPPDRMPMVFRGTGWCSENHRKELDKENKNDD